jgi:hypothetical protein
MSILMRKSPTLPFPTLLVRPPYLLSSRFCGSSSRDRPIEPAQNIKSPLVNPGLIRFPGAGHVQDFDIVAAQEISQRSHFVAKGIRVEYSFFPRVIDV